MNKSPYVLLVVALAVAMFLPVVSFAQSVDASQAQMQLTALTAEVQALEREMSTPTAQGKVLGASAIGEVQTVTAVAKQSTGVTATISPSAGNLLVVGIHLDSPTGPIGSVSDNKGDVFKKAVDLTISASGGEYSAIYYLNDVPAAVTKVTIQFPYTTQADVVVSEYGGADPSVPLDVVSSFDNGWNSSKPFTSGMTAGLSESNELLFGFFADSYNAQNWTAGSGWTSRGAAKESFAEDMIAGTSAGVSATANIAARSGYWVGGLVAAFRPAASSSLPGGGSSGGDTEPPTVPHNLSAHAVSSSEIDLVWNASTDNVGVLGYKIYRGGMQIATSVVPAYADTALAPATAYAYAVAAYDAAGNVSAESPQVSATTESVVPNQAPVVSSFLATPTSIQLGQSTTLLWTVTGSPTPAVSISGIGTVTGSSLMVNPTQTTSYVLSATNAAGGEAQSTTVTVTAANPPPPPPPASAPGPQIFFADVASGPTTGGPGNFGVPISIFGKGFGAIQGSSTVTIGGVPVASYLVWGQNNSGNKILDMIVVQPGPAVTGGAVVVTVNGVASNANITFTPKSGAIYYVATTGKDSNSCSVSSPCATISHVAENVMKAGDVLLVRGGTYAHDSIWIRDDYGESGAPGSQKLIKNYPGEKVSETKLSDNFIVDAFYVTVSGIDFPDGSGLIIAGWANPNESGDQFYNNTFEGNGSYWAVNILGSNHVIAGNDCEYSGSTVGTEGQCYYVETGNNIQLLHNVAGGEGGYGIQLHEETRGANDPTRIIQNILIDGNLLKNSPQRSGLIAEIDGCTGPNGCNAIKNVTIRNNIFTANNFAGIELGESEGATVSGIDIYNNTFYENGRQGITVDNSPYISSVDIENNLIHQGANANCHNNCSWYPVAQLQTGSLDPQVTIRNNYYYPLPVAIMNENGDLLAGEDSSAITGTVQFVNPTALDFHVLPGSATIDAGVNLGASVPTDYDGVLRPQGAAYDIGAYEYPAISAGSNARQISVPLSVAQPLAVTAYQSAAVGGVASTVSGTASSSVGGLQNGGHAMTTGRLNVRATPGGKILGVEIKGGLGTVVGGPASAANGVWWQVQWQNGLSGWSNASYIVP